MPDDQVIYEETKLFKLLILVPLSTANVEHEFSVLPIWVTKLCISILTQNINQLMHLALLSEPDQMSDKT